MKATNLMLVLSLFAALFVVACAPAEDQDTTVVDTDEDGADGGVFGVVDAEPDTVNVYEDDNPDSIFVQDSTPDTTVNEGDTTNNYYGSEDTETTGTTGTTATTQ